MKSNPRDEPDIVEIEYEPEKLLYCVTDRPPVHLSIFFAIQQVLVALSMTVAISTFAADAACASDFPDIKTTMLSSSLFMNGITTLMMITVGIRLPLFQGASGDYVIPLMAMNLIDKEACELPADPTFAMNITSEANNSYWSNVTKVDDIIRRRNLAFSKLQIFEGCLILAGIIHFLVGATGAVGLLLKFVGPVTVVPTILLSGIFLSNATAKFGRPHWGIAFTTAATAILLSLYLGHKNMPCLAWSRKKGFYIYWYPFHQVYSILIGILVGWVMSAVMTCLGMLTDDPKDFQFQARTDAQAGIIAYSSWFRVPYPNQFGPPSFNAGVFVAFLIGTIMSILDSIGDYYACVRICNVHPPPKHAINRGIAVEGFCSIISGMLACGHATSTTGASIGAIGITKVASRHVFLWVSLIYIVFGVVGKISAIFITMPVPVLGGAMIVMAGMFNGVVLSNLQALSLSSTRNLAIIGTSLLVGLMIPYWLESNQHDINTGNARTDNLLRTLLSIPNLCGGILACFLDNTVRGTDEERGIAVWHNPEKGSERHSYSSGVEIYTPLLPANWKTMKIMKYIPFCLYEPNSAKRQIETEEAES